MDPDNPASKYSRHFVISKNGCPEECLMSFRDTENLMPLEKPADKTRIFQILLKGQALNYLNII
jgi:hypothetical protein